MKRQISIQTSTTMASGTYMLAEGDAGSNSDASEDDNSSETEWTKEVSDFPSSPLTAPFTGVSGGPAHDAPVLDFLALYLDDGFFYVLASQTNLYAEQCRSAAQQAGKPHQTKWNPTSSLEMRAFVSINIAMGFKVQLQLYDYWSTDPLCNDPWISETMSRNRFIALNRYLHLSDSTQAPGRDMENYDPLYKVRPLVDSLNIKFPQFFKPGKNLSIDESMIGFKGKHHFKQYCPKKPTKWGFKVWTLCDSSNGYFLRFDVYTGKAITADRSVVRREFGLGYDVVTNLANDYFDVGHHIYFDRYFSSLHLCEYLLSRATYSCATILLNRRGLPDDAKKAKLKQEGELVEYQKGEVLLSIAFHKRQISFLSTGQEIGKMATPHETRACVNYNYNCHMGGVDKGNQNVFYYSVGRSGRKWWRYIFWWGINVSIINAYVIWKETHNNTAGQAASRPRHKCTHLYFRKEVVKAL